MVVASYKLKTVCVVKIELTIITISWTGHKLNKTETHKISAELKVGRRL